MMQDYPKTLPQDALVGFTTMAQVRFLSSPFGFLVVALLGAILCMLLLIIMIGSHASPGSCTFQSPENMATTQHFKKQGIMETYTSV
jgi:hypothetical protein